MKWLKASLLSFIILILFVSIASAQQSDGVWYAKKGIADHSNAATAGSIAWIKAKIGEGYGVIVLSGGVFTITGDLTLGKKISLKILPGSSIYSADGDELVISGQLESGAFQIFNGVDVDLTDANLSAAFAEWFGAIGDDDAGDDGPAIQACAVAAKRCDLVQGRTYCAKTKINLPSSSILDGHNATLKGHSSLDDYVLAIEGTVDLRYNNTESNFGLAKTKVTIRDLNGNPNDSPGFLKILSAYYVTIERVSITDWSVNPTGRVLLLIRNSFHIKIQTCSLHGKDQPNTYGLYLSSDGDSKGFRVLNNIEMDTSIVQHCAYNIYTDLNERTGTTHLACGNGIVTVGVNAAGSGYESGDLLAVIPTDPSVTGGGMVIVDSVDGSGGVTAVSVRRKGYNYSVSNGESTYVHSGSTGTGCKINILSVTNAVECSGLPANTLTFINNAILDKKDKGSPHWGYGWYFRKGNIGNLNLIGNKVERCLSALYIHGDMGRHQITIDGLNTSNTYQVFDFGESDDAKICYDDDEEDPSVIPCPDGPLGKIELRGIKVQTTKSSPDPPGAPNNQFYKVFNNIRAKVVKEDYEIELLDVDDYTNTGVSIAGRYTSVWSGTGIGDPPSIVTHNAVRYRCKASHTSSSLTEPGVGDNSGSYWVVTSPNGGWSATAWTTGTAYVKGSERGRWYNAFSNNKVIDDTYNAKYSQDNITYFVNLESGSKTINLPVIGWSGMVLRFNVMDGYLGRLYINPDDTNKIVGNGTVYGSLANGDRLYSEGGTDGSQLGCSMELVSDYYNGWWVIKSITGTWTDAN